MKIPINWEKIAAPRVLLREFDLANSINKVSPVSGSKTVPLNK